MLNGKKFSWGNSPLYLKILIALAIVQCMRWIIPNSSNDSDFKNEVENIFLGEEPNEDKSDDNLKDIIEEIDETITFKSAIDSINTTHSSIFIYTNDTTNTLTNFKVYPNAGISEKSIDNSHSFYRESTLKAIKTFLKHKDSLGYYATIKKNNHTFQLKRYKNNNDSIKFKLITYFKPTKAFSERPINKRNSKLSFLYGKKPDSFETRNFIYKESHLKNLKKRYKFAPAVLRPYYKDFFDDTFKFYFFCYNKNIPKDTLQNYINLLVKGSLGEYNCKTCNIIEVKNALKE